MAKREIKINLRRVLFIVVFLVALATITIWLLAREDFYAMLLALRGANYLFVISAIGVYFFSTGIWAMRWRMTFSSTEYRVGLRDLYPMICGCIFINNVTPMLRVGGDPFGRVYMLRKLKKVPYPIGFATTLGEHVFDLPILLSFLMMGLLLFLGKISFWLALVLIGIWISAVSALALLPFRILKKRVGTRGIRRLITSLLGRFRKRVHKIKVARSIEKFYSSAQTVIGGWRNALCIAGLSIASWSLDVLRIFFVFLALGYQPPLAMLLFASTLPTITGLIPFIPGGLIVVEATLLSVFLLFGVPLNLAIAATLIERSISLVLGSLAGVGALSYLGIKWAR